jgi:plasmid stabilization system protein ParE
MLRVRFTTDARADLDDALHWYETHAPEIASQFLDSLRAIVARIAENPRQFPASAYQTRLARLRRFPYLVIFRETDTDAYVVAVFHTSRDPAAWRKRIPKVS